MYNNDPVKIKNREIFKDSKEIMESNPILKEAIKKTIESQKIYYEADPLTCLPSGSEKPLVFVSNKTTAQAAGDYSGQKVCILNFASFTRAGGGVGYGCKAQEESLCRITTLYPCIATKEMDKKFYKPHQVLNNPLHNDDLIYSPGVVIFKDDGPRHNLLPDNEFVKVDVISIAAPNFSNKPTNLYNPHDGDEPASLSDDKLLLLLEKRFDRLLQVAHINNVEILILGAIGCGAFRNPPDVVAAAFRNSIEKYGNGFKMIEFAIPGPMEQINYQEFKSAFSGKAPAKAKTTEVKKSEVTFPDLTGEKVSHTLFGDGAITSSDGEKVTVDFGTQTKTLNLRVACPNFLSFDNPKIHEKISQLLK